MIAGNIDPEAAAGKAESVARFGHYFFRFGQRPTIPPKMYGAANRRSIS